MFDVAGIAAKHGKCSESKDFKISAPIAQRIEHRPPKPRIPVQFQLGANFIYAFKFLHCSSLSRIRGALPARGIPRSFMPRINLKSL